MKALRKSLVCVLMLIFAALVIPTEAFAVTSFYSEVNASNGELAGYGVLVESGSTARFYSGIINENAGGVPFTIRDMNTGYSTSIDYLESIGYVNAWKVTGSTTGLSAKLVGVASPVAGETITAYYYDYNEAAMKLRQVRVGTNYGLFDDGTALVEIDTDLSFIYDVSDGLFTPVYFLNSAGKFVGMLPGGAFGSTGSISGYLHLYAEWFNERSFSGGTGSATQTPAPTASTSPSSTPSPTPAPSPSTTLDTTVSGGKSTDLEPRSGSSTKIISSSKMPTWLIILICVVAAVVACTVIFLIIRRKKHPAVDPQFVQEEGHTVPLDQVIPTASAAKVRQQKPVGPIDPDDSGYRVVGVAGVLQGRRLRVSNSGALNFGRNPKDCNVVFPADTPGVSGRHCSLWIKGGEIFLMDLGSTNGTILSNGARLQPNQPVKLHEGDSFSLGSSQQTVQLVRKF